MQLCGSAVATPKTDDEVLHIECIVHSSYLIMRSKFMCVHFTCNSFQVCLLVPCERLRRSTKKGESCLVEADAENFLKDFRMHDVLLISPQSSQPFPSPLPPLLLCVCRMHLLKSTKCALRTEVKRLCEKNEEEVMQNREWGSRPHVIWSLGDVNRRLASHVVLRTLIWCNVHWQRCT